VPDDHPLNDAIIGDDERLLRRIGPFWAVSDGAGGKRVASAAFQDRTVSGITALSVHRESVLENHRLAPEDLLTDFDGYGLVAFTAAEARKLGLGVAPAELPDDGPRGLAHAHVHGKKTGAIKNALAKGCEKLIWPF
jgi:hypothetical protein